MCQISAPFQDIDILNHGIQKRLSRVEASTSERRKRSYDVEEEVDESVTSGKSSTFGKPDPKFLPTNLETLSTAEVQAIFNQSVVYNESKIDGLFTQDEIFVFIWCLFWHVAANFLVRNSVKQFKLVETKSAACQIFCAKFKRFLCKFCTKNQKF